MVPSAAGLGAAGLGAAGLGAVGLGAVGLGDTHMPAAASVKLPEMQGFPRLTLGKSVETTETYPGAC